MLKLGYVIQHVANVEQTIQFYHTAFQLPIKMVHSSKMYGELDTGATLLAFAQWELLDSAITTKKNTEPNAYEIVLVTAAIDDAYKHAIEHGAVPIMPPTKKPWNQIIAYVRDLNGALVELATPMN